MSAPNDVRQPPDRDRPSVQQRTVTDWEYKTAYLLDFQARLPASLLDRLKRWADQREKRLNDLVVELLEQTVAERGCSSGTVDSSAGGPTDKPR